MALLHHELETRAVRVLVDHWHIAEQTATTALGEAAGDLGVEVNDLAALLLAAEPHRPRGAHRSTRSLRTWRCQTHDGLVADAPQPRTQRPGRAPARQSVRAGAYALGRRGAVPAGRLSRAGSTVRRESGLNPFSTPQSTAWARVLTPILR